ncbi:MAG: flippase [Eubacteriales bacterium]|nr:flippase [Eubacteriales bacterium]
MKEKSIAKNTVIYTVKILASMIFPLITFPYISRVLTPEGVGKYNFSASVISYFSLLAALGISTYAIREGSKVRDDKAKLEKLAQELFTVNMISTIFAYSLFLIALFTIDKFIEYWPILLILSTTLPLSALGTEWIFSIYEDYTYITYRSIAFQFLSLVLMFIFVKDQSDINIYALITVVSNVGSNVFNYIHANNYFRHRIIISRRLRQHLSPILILFASAVASQIYVNSDITMLGFFKTDYDVGLYSAATKIYNIIRSVLTAFITVLTPRLTFYYSQKNKSLYRNLLKKSLSGYLSIMIPASIGLCSISKYAIMLLSGENYIAATPALRILAVALLFSTIGSFVANEVLIIFGKEKKILAATVTGAIFNFCGNLILIPTIGFVGAAMTTLLSEVLVFGIQLYYGRKCVKKMEMDISELIKVLISCIPMVFISIFLESFSINIILKMGIIIGFSIFTYVIFIILLQHSIIDLAKEYLASKKKGV